MPFPCNVRWPAFGRLRTRLVAVALFVAPLAHAQVELEPYQALALERILATMDAPTRASSEEMYTLMLAGMSEDEVRQLMDSMAIDITEPPAVSTDAADDDAGEEPGIEGAPGEAAGTMPSDPPAAGQPAAE